MKPTVSPVKRQTIFMSKVNPVEKDKYESKRSKILINLDWIYTKVLFSEKKTPKSCFKGTKGHKDCVCVCVFVCVCVCFSVCVFQCVWR